jgi:hypothetical protein
MVEALGKLGWLPIGKSRMLDCNYCVVQVMGIVTVRWCLTSGTYLTDGLVLAG